MNVTAKIPWHIGISVLRPVRHTDILGAIMDIHFCDDRPKAVVSVVVALDENELAI